jgi:hypothetical protein
MSFGRTGESFVTFARCFAEMDMVTLLIFA